MPPVPPVDGDGVDGAAGVAGFGLPPFTTVTFLPCSTRSPLSQAFALLIVAALLLALNYALRPLAESYGSGFRFSFLTSSAAAAVIALSGGLGWLGAHLSVSRHLRNIEPR